MDGINSERIIRYDSNDLIIEILFIEKEYYRIGIFFGVVNF